MKTSELTKLFYDTVHPSLPNEWEVEELLYPLKSLDDEIVQNLFSHIDSIWPISHTLCFRYIEYTASQFEIIGSALLPEWVRWLLAHYEEGGLRKAEEFMTDAAGNFINHLHSPSQVSLTEISSAMTGYIKGVSGQPIRLDAGNEVWSDTETIFLPPILDFFADKENNKLLYKLIISLQWSLISLKSHRFLEIAHPAHYRSSKEPVKQYLFIKALLNIQQQLPGLWKRTKSILVTGLSSEIESTRNNSQAAFFKPLVSFIQNDLSENELFENVTASPSLTIHEYKEFKKRFSESNEPPAISFSALLLGEFNLQKTKNRIEALRSENKKLFIRLAEKNIHPQPSADEADKNNSSAEKSDAAVIISDTIKQAVKAKKSREIIQFDNSNMVLSEDLLQLSSQIINDLGSIPEGYVQAAMGINGQGQLRSDSSPADERNISKPFSYTYDEWDCRRGGYRKDWCTLIEEPLTVQKSNFTELTLTKYQGLRRQLRRQFEMMRTDHRFVGRQRDGDDLDLDAIIDAIGDKKAGKSPSERLFTRLLRNRRNIASIFLVDMSNSTAGWVGSMIKESLVLLSEVMEILGDQYGIYGFSGMRRSRCKVYPIKLLDEKYSVAVQQRIAAIGPKDYTRMAPPIRHMAELLNKTDAKTRLLISLSDGKPEDYDGYFGQYAIEDTRKALMEAKGNGIKSFCFTIDKQAHDYLEHMFGAGNYTFINDIQKLPSRIPQIYRSLTA